MAGFELCPALAGTRSDQFRGLDLTLAAHVLALIAIHFGVRKLAAAERRQTTAQGGGRKISRGAIGTRISAKHPSLAQHLCPYASRLGPWLARKVTRVLEDTETYVQTLNHRFTNPYAVNGEPAQTADSDSANA